MPLDPDDSASWVNIPCPVDLKPIQNELTKAGGLNQFGKPNFIIVWGQEYKTFDLGRKRIHFDEGLIPASIRPSRFACRPEVYEKALKWIEGRERERRDAYLRLDWARYGKYTDVAEFFASSAVFSGDWIRLSDDPSVDAAEAMKLMPDGWRYISGLYKHEYIGQQCFYVLQWLTPREFGSKDDWDSNRYGDEFVPETQATERMVDVTGPFPTNGAYENVALRIGKKHTLRIKHSRLINETVEYDIYRFKEPTIQNTVEPLQELLHIRDRLTHAEKSKEYRDNQRRAKFHEDMETAKSDHSDLMKALVRDAAPVGYGNPTNISANKTKFDN